MKLKVLATATLICSVTISTSFSVLAGQAGTNNIVSDADLESYETISVDEQIEKLFDETSEYTGLDSKYIDILYKIAGGKADYVDTEPDVYIDTTIESSKGALTIDGANTVWIKAPYIENNMQRDSERYLPDAVYSVAYDIKAIMTQRQYYNREGNQEYFDNLNEDSRNNIVFLESLLLYTGENEESVNNIINVHSKIMSTKNDIGNIVSIIEDKPVIKNEYIEIFNSIGITDSRSLSYIAITLNNLDIDSDVQIETPYIANYASRENMMIAALSLTGKVRYVWGGGHVGTANIDGINPIWEQWESLYPKSGSGLDGIGTSIRPIGSWCPIHGYTSAEYHGNVVTSADSYLNLRREIIPDINENEYKYRNILSQIEYSEDTSEHLIDGLDCSGYASWIYNQITSDYEYNQTALYFMEQSGIKEVAYGSKLLPGDVFAWSTHIVTIVGKVRDNSKVYVCIEEVPNVLRFGVIYYGGASNSDIELAKQIAMEANQLLGNIDTNTEEVNMYNMDAIGAYTEKTVSEQLNEETGEITEVEETSEKYYKAIGRYNGKFYDEDTIIEQYGTSYSNLTAQQIIEYTLTKLPLSYVSGYNVYDGELFNKELAASNLGVTVQ